MTTGERDAFWARVKRYREIGLDPLKWIAGCSVQVEGADIVFPALGLAREPMAALAATAQLGDGPDVFEVHARRTPAVRALVHPHVRAAQRRNPARANPNRAALMMRVSQQGAETAERFAAALEGAIAGLPGPTWDAPITIGQLHAVTTSDARGEFASFELFQPGEGEAVGYAAASCRSLEISDATLDPLSEEHVATVLAGALAGPCSLGATKDIEVYPAFDAPGKKAQDAVASSFAAQARELGCKLVEREPLGTGKLFLGATVIGHTDREPPNRHHYVKRGMQVMLTRPLGDLAPLAVYLSCLSDPEYEARAAAAGFDLSDLEKARGTSTASLTRPALEESTLLRAFSPALHEPPELSKHIAATADLGTGGLIGVADLARRYDVEVRVDAVPMAHPEIARFATGAHLMDNATAAAPGTLAIVAYPSVLDELERALETQGHMPARIGTVAARGEAALIVPEAASQFVGSKRLAKRLTVAKAGAP